MVRDDFGLGAPSGALPLSSVHKVRVRNGIRAAGNHPSTDTQGAKKPRSKATARHRRTKSEEWEQIRKRTRADSKRFSKFLLPAIEALRRKQVTNGQDPTALWLGMPIWAPYADEEKDAPSEWEDEDEDVHNEFV
ncbi:hypothetical protein LTR95_000681 [Oleoguttula sp. CCFEE 5521]